jgi:hypothetical protein
MTTASTEVVVYENEGPVGAKRERVDRFLGEHAGAVHGSADAIVVFADLNVEAVSRKSGRGHQTGGAASYHDGVTHSGSYYTDRSDHR